MVPSNRWKRKCATFKDIFPTGLIISPSHEAVLPDINPANIETILKQLNYEYISLGILLIFISGFFQGTYGLGMKKYQPLSWEAFWILFSILSMFVIPAIWISLTVPDSLAALCVASEKDIWAAICMGALWGIGALLWGFGIVQIGMSLTYGIGMSMTAISGSLGMLIQMEGVTQMPFSLI